MIGSTCRSKSAYSWRFAHTPVSVHHIIIWLQILLFIVPTELIQILMSVVFISVQ